jgi:hypothetical protein
VYESTVSPPLTLPSVSTTTPVPPPDEVLNHTEYLPSTSMETTVSVRVRLLSVPITTLSKQLVNRDVGIEGIVSKHRDRAYRAGRSAHWIKAKNPASAAMRRAAEVSF